VLAHGQAVDGVGIQALKKSVVWVVVVAPLLAACWCVTARYPLGALTVGIYVAVAGFLVLCESWLTFDREWGSAIRGSKTDFLYVIIATVMDKASFVVCVTAIASIGRGLASYFQISVWPGGRSLALQVVVALLIADAMTYFRHRLSHKSSVLWRFHRIHHSMTELYWIRSAYTHPLEQLLILTAIMLPIAFLGAGDDVVAVVAFVFGLSGLVQHANIDARSSILNYVFATPEVHRVHHRVDEGSHSNFSAFFVLMDILFRTYDPPVRPVMPVRVGLDDAPAFPRDFLSQLVIPFRRDPTGRERDGVSEPSRCEVAAVNEP
jgi:sterol desaturase/sphingolipid hydroxylase (fatty acid hydroxylase superfamily)